MVLTLFLCCCQNLIFILTISLYSRLSLRTTKAIYDLVNCIVDIIEISKSLAYGGWAFTLPEIIFLNYLLIHHT